MGLVKIASDDPFSRVPKKLLKDQRLSWKAKGIMAYLLGHPLDWEVRINDVIKQSTDGRDAVYSAMAELRDAGYAVFSKNRSDGRFVQNIWTVRDTPLPGFPEAVSPEAVFPDSEKPDLTKIERKLRKKETEKETTLARLAVESPLIPPQQLNGHSSLPISFPKAIERFAQWSKAQGFHIVSKDRRGNTTYAKGAQSGGWTRQTLARWETFYQGLAERKSPGQIKRVVGFYTENCPGDPFLTVCHTFPKFAESFDRIESALRRQRRIDGEEDDAPQSAKRPEVIERIVSRNGKKLGN